MDDLKACGFLITRGDPVESFLLMVHPHRYDLPKGHIEPGETDLECALRELREETGIGESDLDIDPEFRFVTRYQVCSRRTDFQPRDKTLVIFWGRLKREPTIIVSEHAAYQWFAWKPPHQIQRATVDPLLAALAKYLHRQV